MKRLAIIPILIIIMALTACSSLQVNLTKDPSLVAIETCSFILGDLVGQNNPDRIDQMLQYCNMANSLTEGNVNEFVDIGLDYLEKYDDSGIRAYLDKLREHIDIKMQINEGNLATYVIVVKAVCQGFADGLRHAQGIV